MKLRLIEVDGMLCIPIPLDLVEEFALESGDSLDIDFPDEDLMTVILSS